MSERIYKIIIICSIILACAAIFLFVFSIPARLQFFENVCHSPLCKDSGQLSQTLAEKLSKSNIDLSFYAKFKVALDVGIALIYTSVGALILGKNRRNSMAIYSFLVLVLIGTSFTSGALTWNNREWTWPVRIHEAMGWVMFVPFFYLFPTGKMVPKWTYAFALLWVIIEIPYNLFPQTIFSSQTWPGWLSSLVFMSFWVSCIFAQVYRYKNRSNPIEKLQTKWFMFGLISMVLSIFIGGSAGLLPENTNANLISFYFLGTQVVQSAGLALIPLTIAYAIFKHHLWSIDLILRRTILYGTLTFTIIGFHVLVVSGLGALLQAPGNIVISLFSTAIIALLFQPFTSYLQRVVNRLIYGERDEPFAVLVRLGERLEGTLPLDEVLPTLLETIIKALKLPYAEVILENGVSHLMGDRPHEYYEVPLIYQGQSVGILHVGLRSPAEKFTHKDLKLISQLSRQVGVAAHSIILNTELQNSRKKLVTTREEERKRLRRDLHDGIGPSLAAQTIKVGVARQLLHENPESADKLLSSLESDLSNTLTEIRHIIYNLRPPSLDDLGLIGAINEFITQLKKPDQLKDQGNSCIFIFKQPPQSLPELSAALQVAAFRIIQEALTNVIRHSKATTCEIEIINQENGLKVVVTDNGCGIPPKIRKGVGLLSMQERAAEIGGYCTISPRVAQGTTVEAYLPF